MGKHPLGIGLVPSSLKESKSNCCHEMTENTCQWYVNKLTQMKTTLFQTQEQLLKWYETESDLCLVTDHSSTFTVTWNTALALERASVGTTANAVTAALHSSSHVTSSGLSYSVMRAVHSSLHSAKPADEKRMRWHLTHQIHSTDAQARHLEGLSATGKPSSWQHRTVRTDTWTKLRASVLVEGSALHMHVLKY